MDSPSLGGKARSSAIKNASAAAISEATPDSMAPCNGSTTLKNLPVDSDKGNRFKVGNAIR